MGGWGEAGGVVHTPEVPGKHLPCAREKAHTRHPDILVCFSQRPQRPEYITYQKMADTVEKSKKGVGKPGACGQLPVLNVGVGRGLLRKRHLKKQRN